jgi:hypothetical protein
MSKFKARIFNQESYDTNDAYGKAIVTAWLKDQDWVEEIIDEEDFGIDLEAIDKEGKSHFFEAEVKGNYPWSDKESFPFSTVSFLGRKKKWEGKGFFYALVCAETKALCIAHSSEIFKEEFREVRRIKTSHRNGLDAFYRVPKDLCRWVSPK